MSRPRLNRVYPIHSAGPALAASFIAATLLGLAVGPIRPAAAQEAGSSKGVTADRTDLERLEAEIAAGRARVDALSRDAAQLAHDEADLRRQLVEAAAEVQQWEQRLSDVEVRLFDLMAQESTILARLAERRDAIGDLMIALEALALNRPPTLGVRPDDATEAARSAMLLNALIPAVRAEALALEGELKQLAGVRADIRRDRSESVAAARSLEVERKALEQLVTRMTEERATVLAEAEDAQARLSALAEEAADLRGFLALLAERGLAAVPRPRPERDGADKGGSVASLSGGGAIGALRGQLKPPVTGDLARRFGAKLDNGGKSLGLVFATRPAAQVISPCDGAVLFSGRFMGYGLLLIIGTDDGYHFVLSGLSRIDAVVGQRLLAGEPVGIMGDARSEPGAAGPPELYVELRRAGEPVDPLPWLSMSDRKVSG